MVISIFLCVLCVSSEHSERVVNKKQLVVDVLATIIRNVEHRTLNPPKALSPYFLPQECKP